jgi:hypothetical protein
MKTQILAQTMGEARRLRLAMALAASASLLGRTSSAILCTTGRLLPVAVYHKRMHMNLPFFLGKAST